MDYDESSIQVVDAVAAIQRRPQIYVGPVATQPEFLPGFLATGLAGDVLHLGVKRVEIHHAGDWWAVASDEDWLAYKYHGHLAAHYGDLSVRDVFNRILPVPGMVNSCRSEVIIRALAASVFTTREEALTVLSGDEVAIQGMLARNPFCRLRAMRVVAFIMAPDGAHC